MSVVGGEASLDWLDLRRPEFDGSGLREDGDHDGYPFSVLLDSQDFALPASVRATDDSTLSPDCTLIGITSKKTRLLPISAESHQHSPAIGLTRRISRGAPCAPSAACVCSASASAARR